MFWDVISLIVLLAIGAGFLQALLSMAGPGRNRRRTTLDDLRDRGPRSFAESGGQPVAARRPPAPQELQPERRMRHPAPARPVRRMHTADEPTAEERPRIAPRPTLRPVLRSGARAGQIRRQLNDPRSVRAAFVLREVLDRPLSLRDRG